MRLGSGLLLAIVVAFDAAADEWITVRALPSLPSSVIEYIAQVSQPRSEFVPPRELPERFIKEVCLNYTNAFGNVFFNQLNKSLERVLKPYQRPVKLPACAKWRYSESGDGFPVIVSAGDDLDAILLRKIGRTANRMFKCAPEEASQSNRCGQTFRALVQQLNKGLDLANLRPGDTVFLPFITYPATFRIRTNADVDAAGVISKIEELSNSTDPDSSLIQASIAPPVWMIAPAALDEVGSQEQACSNARQIARAKNRPWPYDEQLVASIIRRNVSRARTLGQQTNPATLTILDTGLDSSFPRALLRRDESVDPKYAYGIGVSRRDNIQPYSNHKPDEVRMHGTEVAKVVAGISALQTAYPELSSLFRLNVVNLMEPRTAAEYGITTGGLTTGIDWFVTHGEIANVSIASRDDLPGLRGLIRGNPQLLVVSAAGNESERLHVDASYPANYGGANEETGTQFITVAAYDGNLVRATFSNFSSTYADLFAPGCDVSLDPSKPGMSGTSFAAPLVSMTAALLRSFGLKTPKEIKRRLHASVDYDDYLKDLVLWSGRLNIAKALSLFEDVLETRSKGLSFGRWDVSGDLCLDEAFDADAIKKINVLNSTDALSIRILWSDSQGKLQTYTCKPSGETLPISERGIDPKIPWKDIVDFVPRHFKR